MGFFSRSYEPGGVHHIRITDSVFEEAQKLIRTDEDIRKHYQEVAKDEDCSKYEAHDFPVAEIIGSFMLSYELQEEKNGIPENLRIGNIKIGRKDQAEFNKFTEKYNQRIRSKADAREEAWAQKGLGGKLFSLALGAATDGVKKAATGKSRDLREFDKFVGNYICGDSSMAKEYISKFVIEIGVDDDGIKDVTDAIRQHFWMAEFAKHNRSK